MQITQSPYHTNTEVKEEKNLVVSWREFEVKAVQLAAAIGEDEWLPDAIIGIGRGGWELASALSRMLPGKPGSYMCKSYEQDGFCTGTVLKSSKDVCFIGELKGRVLVVDDLVEKGKTLEHTCNFIATTHKVDVRSAIMFRKSETEFEPNYYVDDVEADVWIHMPNEIYEKFDLSRLSKEELFRISKDPELAAKILDNLPGNPREKLSSDQISVLIK